LPLAAMAGVASTRFSGEVCFSVGVLRQLMSKVITVRIEKILFIISFLFLEMNFAKVQNFGKVECTILK